MSTEFFKVNGVNVANIKNDSDNVFFGIGVLAGSNYETPEQAGISHFAEHMFFKGTTTRNWKDINQEFAKLGVSPNAYTSHNQVLYYSTAPKENIGGVVELMMDMMFNSTYPTDELEKERGVILEEKKMYEDNPSQDFVNKMLEEMFVWQKGHNTIGTNKVIENVTREDIKAFLEDRINLGNLMLICSGNVETEDLKKYLSANIPSEHPYLTEGDKNEMSEEFWSNACDSPDRVKFLLERDNIQQSTVNMVMDALSVYDSDYMISQIVTSAIGGGMYSTLFSKIREEMGLCYSVSMSQYALGYPEDNLVWLSGSMATENVTLFMDECEKVINDVKENGIDQDLFECAKTDTLASMYRSTETSSGKARELFAQYLDGNRDGLEKTIEDIKAVTIEDCNRVAKRLFFDNQFNWSVMNPKV